MNPVLADSCLSNSHTTRKYEASVINSQKMIKKNAFAVVTTSTIAPRNRSVKKLTETFSGASVKEYKLVAIPSSEMIATRKVESKSSCRMNDPNGWIANHV